MKRTWKCPWCPTTCTAGRHLRIHINLYHGAELVREGIAYLVRKGVIPEQRRPHRLGKQP